MAQDQTLTRQERSSALGYATNPLDRVAQFRDNPAKQSEFAADPRRLELILEGDHPFFRFDGQDYGLWFTPQQADAIGASHLTVFLGLLDGIPTFARAHAARQPEQPAPTGYFTSDLRSIAVHGLMPAAELGILAQAKSLIGWHAHFVAQSYSCLAGFIEPGETLEDAVRREVYEEAGIEVSAVRYLCNQPWPFPSSLMIGCLAQAKTHDIVMDAEELEDARWFTREDVRGMLTRTHPQGLICPPPIAIAHSLMQAWAFENITV